MEKAVWVLVLILFHAAFELPIVQGQTNPEDTSVLRSLMSEWQNTPPTWGKSEDPCGTPWEGVFCENRRVTSVKLASMGLKGVFSGDIASLSELQSLDLSYNNDLSGTLTGNIGKLKKLRTLILIGCSFGGSIPSELGTIPELYFLALNLNKFTGNIPDSLGDLSKLYWFDIADNQLSGTLPVSSSNTSGLDKLTNTKHFHFGNNQLSGTIPPEIFHPNMTLIHVLFEGNNLTGSIPNTIGLVQTLEVLRLDKNQLSGPVPSSIKNLTHVTELNLANNQLTGSLPDLTEMTGLTYVDLSNNTFNPSERPSWFSNLRSLTTLIIESGGISGEIPLGLLSSPQIEQVILRNNSLNGTLDLSDSISKQLQLVDLQNNKISDVTPGGGSAFTLILVGNPYCLQQTQGTEYCQLQQEALKLYSTSLATCASKPPCPNDQSQTPWTCKCAYPYKGTMFFRAPSFSDLTNVTTFQSLEKSLWEKLGLVPYSVYLKIIPYNRNDYLEVQVELFPSDHIYFDRTEILRLGFHLSNQSYKPPPIFGPFYFMAQPYAFLDGKGKESTISTGLIAGVAAACAILAIGLVGLTIYIFRQKKRAEMAQQQSHPFESWGGWRSSKDNGAAPQLKGARWFSFDDLRKCTYNFSVSNEIGSGGYGKVYRGSLSNGQLVAIKRAQQGSMQGGVEFKTEIELLSRVHHRNLARLVGFCFEQGEQMLVYEYIPNGTVRESLSGKSGIVLDWKRRLRIALGSARGLAYLHELADPPIIHRDVKTSNILLDENLSAKVADFGLSKLLTDVKNGHVSTQVKGTMGYLDPEYYTSQQLSEKSDVYSFGVVMLELITAKLPIERGKYIVREVKLLFNRNDELRGLTDIMDSALRNSPNLVGFGSFVDLAMGCVEELGVNRPSMNEVVKEIEMILQNEGSNPTSASSSATDFLAGKGVSRHPYNDPLPRKVIDSNTDDASDSSFGYVLQYKIEPK